MRWLFFILLLVNAGYLGWNVYQERTHELKESAVPDRKVNKGNLVLLSEHKQPMSERASFEGKDEQEPKSEPPPEQQSVAAVDEQGEMSAENTCFRIKGLKKEKEARKLSSLLKSKGFGSLKLGSVQLEEHRYWVKVVGGRNKKQVAGVLKSLKKAGLRDFYLIQGADIGNTISLGVFSSKEAAEKRYRTVKRLKFNPKIDELSLPVRRWWVSTGAIELELVEDALQSLAIRDTQITHEACK